MNMEMIVAVKGVIITSGKVLILKRSEEEEISPGTWELPGGKMDFGEQLESALVREIREETSLYVTVEKLLYVSTFTTNPCRQVVIISYLCRSKHKDVVLSFEHCDYKWASKSELSELLPPGILQDFKKNHVFSLDELEITNPNVIQI
ncbi:NUDIX hydrolase [Peribacillus acanthi]|uniref:NUDIX hydrolase n=1 Tax=Peribacillus acanthi TaxID=2171554 RepID=UPI000D3E07D3|nr:NUDIX domain-containing protein [Peribacillus acanthi]